MDFSWPGNVRQLKNAMERLALMKTDGRIDIKDLSFICDLSLLEESPPGWRFVLGLDNFDLPAEGLNLETLTERIFRQALDKNKGNQTHTAEYLGISRRALQGRLKKMGIN